VEIGAVQTRAIDLSPGVAEVIVGALGALGADVGVAVIELLAVLGFIALTALIVIG
jgi:hypothetical protein